MDGVELPQGYSHFEEAVYFFTILLINKVKEVASDALAVLTQSNQELLHQRKWQEISKLLKKKVIVYIQFLKRGNFSPQYF